MKVGDLITTLDGKWIGIIMDANVAKNRKCGYYVYEDKQPIYRVLWTMGSYHGRIGWAAEDCLKLLSRNR